MEEWGDTLGDLKDQTPAGYSIVRWQTLGNLLTTIAALLMISFSGAKNYRVTMRKTDPSVDGPEELVDWKCRGIMQTERINNMIDGDMYEALMYQRLEDLEPYIGRLDEELDADRVAQRLQQQQYRYQRQRKAAADGGGDDWTDKNRLALFVPQPNLKRKADKTWAIFENNCQVKKVRFSLDKRWVSPEGRLPPSGPHPVGFDLRNMATLPFGFNNIGDPAPRSYSYDGDGKWE